MSAGQVKSVDHRNYGIDLLRIVSMMMICMLHVLKHGGVLEAAQVVGGINYAVASFGKALVMCAVNCFAMITGYVCCSSKHKLSNILNLTIQVTFYSVLINCIFLLRDEVSVMDFAKAFFLGMYGQYWYFSSYFIMFFFIPVLNMFVEFADRSVFRTKILAVMIAVGALPTLFHCDPANARLGFSTIWLMVVPFRSVYQKI